MHALDCGMCVGCPLSHNIIDGPLKLCLACWVSICGIIRSTVEIYDFDGCVRGHLHLFSICILYIIFKYLYGHVMLWRVDPFLL